MASSRPILGRARRSCSRAAGSPRSRFQRHPKMSSTLGGPDLAANTSSAKSASGTNDAGERAGQLSRAAYPRCERHGGEIGLAPGYDPGLG